MSAFSNYAEDLVCKALLRGTGFAAPAQIFLTLYTVGPSDAGGGTEAAYSGYARQPITFTNVDVNGTSQNDGTVIFPAVGGVSPVTVTHWGIFDSLTGGNLLFHGALAASKTLDPNDVPSFPANSLRITFN